MGQLSNYDAKFEGLSSDYKSRLSVIIILNASMFCIGLSSGYFASSQALQADALDFFGDALTCSFSLFVIGYSIQMRAKAALIKAISLLIIGGWVMVSTLSSFSGSHVPQAGIMGVISILALFVNLASVVLLVKYKNGDANVRSVWLCARNDMIGNIAVMISAIAVWIFKSNIPDLLVGLVLSVFFITSALIILLQAIEELKEAEMVSAKS